MLYDDLDHVSTKHTYPTLKCLWHRYHTHKMFYVQSRFVPYRQAQPNTIFDHFNFITEIKMEIKFSV